jgi:CRISPR-associated protein Cas1
MASPSSSANGSSRSALLLPACRSADTLLTRRHLTLPEASRRRLWEKTIDAKCANQAFIATRIAPDSASTRTTRQGPHSARSARKEGGCAKLVLGGLVSDGLRVEGFCPRPEARRTQRPPELWLRRAAFHRAPEALRLRFRSRWSASPTPSANAVRPSPTISWSRFRPCVDWRIYQWVKDRPHAEAFAVTGEFRRWVTGFSLERVDYLGLELDIRGCIEGVVRSFRQAVLTESTRHYRPWMWKNSKWAGSS